MTKVTKELTAYLVMGILVLVVGIVLGYYIWGVEKGEQPDYRATLTKAADYLGTVEQQNRELKKEKADLQKEIAGLTGKMEEEPDKLNEQINNLKQHVASLTADKEKLQASLDEAMKTAAEKEEALTAEIRELTVKIEELRNKNESLQSAADEQSDLVKENERLKSELTDLVKEKEQMRSELQEALKESDMLKEENERLGVSTSDETGVRKLEEKVEDLKARLEAIQQMAVPQAADAPSETPAEAE
mgnify:CR=1 FL=1